MVRTTVLVTVSVCSTWPCENPFGLLLSTAPMIPSSPADAILNQPLLPLGTMVSNLGVVRSELPVRLVLIWHDCPAIVKLALLS